MPISFKKKGVDPETKKAPAEEEAPKTGNSAAAKLKASVKKPEDIITENNSVENLKESGLAHTLVEKTVDGKKTVEKDETEIMPQSAAMAFAEMSRVSVTLGTKINTGNYNSINMSVTVTLPCKVDEIDEVFTFASGWTEERLGELVMKAQEDAGSDD